jgi:hypothetical protein
MTKNLSVQTYLPPHVVAWLDSEAKQAEVSRSHWVASVLIDLFRGQELRVETRTRAIRTQRLMTFATCALDGLLTMSSDPTLRDRVHQAYKKKIERERQEAGE